MTQHNEPGVVVYTTPTCPDCRTLKAWLNEIGVPLIERDLTAPTVAEEVKTRTDVRVFPITLVGDRVFYGTFVSQKAGLTNALDLHRAA